MKKPLVTLNLYLPNAAKKREIKRKAKLLGKDENGKEMSVSKAVIQYFDSLENQG